MGTGTWSIGIYRVMNEVGTGTWSIGMYHVMNEVGTGTSSKRYPLQMCQVLLLSDRNRTFLRIFQSVLTIRF